MEEEPENVTKKEQPLRQDEEQKIVVSWEPKKYVFRKGKNQLCQILMKS